MAAVREQVEAPSPVEHVLRRAAARGESDPAVITAEVCQAGGALLVLRCLVVDSIPDDATPAAIVDRVVLPSCGVRQLQRVPGADDVPWSR